MVKARNSGREAASSDSGLGCNLLQPYPHVDGQTECGEVLLNVLRCQLTYYGQVVTNAEARFNKSLRPRKPEGSLGRTAQDVHLDSHTAPDL